MTKKYLNVWHSPDSHAPTHAGQAVNQHTAVLPQSSAMNEVIAHGKILREILKKHSSCLWLAQSLKISHSYLIRIIGGHHTQVVLVGEEMFGIIVDGQDVSDAVHLELIQVLRISIVAHIQAR